MDWQILSQAIDDLEIPHYLKSSLKTYISERFVGFRFSDGLDWLIQWLGCPQGSCLGPLLWIIVANKITRRYKDRFLEVVSYADDFLLYTAADTREDLRQKTNERLKFFNEVCQSLNLSINPGKSKSMIFGASLKSPPSFYLNNVRIKVDNSVCFLGLILDAKFSWTKHLEEISQRLTNISHKIKSACLRDRGVRPHILKTWYNTVLLKKVSYGHEIWLEDLQSAGYKKLKKCQRICMLTVSRCYRSVSTEALGVIFGTPPLEISLWKSLTIWKINQQKTIFFQGIHYQAGSFMTRIPTYINPNFIYIKNLIPIDPVISVVPASEFTTLFTDGSKSPEGTSAAFTVNKENEYIFDYKMKFNKENNIYQAELFAILKAMEWAIKNIPANNAIIYTDSLSSIKAIERLFPDNNILLQIFSLAHENPFFNFHIGWVKAHNNVTGNERADLLARSVTEENDYNEYIDLPIPLSHIKSAYNNLIIHEWQTDWSYAENGRHTYHVINKVDSKYLCSSQVQAYFITGHGSFPIHLHKIGKSEHSNCECGKRGDPFHYLFETCTVVPLALQFTYNVKLTPERNMNKILLENKNYNKLRQIYNILNGKYSFIKYKF